MIGLNYFHQQIQSFRCLLLLLIGCCFLNNNFISCISFAKPSSSLQAHGNNYNHLRRFWVETDETSPVSSINQHLSTSDDNFNPQLSALIVNGQKSNLLTDSDNRYEKIYLKFISSLPAVPRYPKFVPKFNKRFFLTESVTKSEPKFWEDDQYESPARGRGSSSVQMLTKATVTERIPYNLKLLDVDNNSNIRSSLSEVKTSSPLTVPSSEFTESPTHFGFLQHPRSPLSSSFSSINYEDKPRDRSSFLKRKTWNDILSDFTSSTSTTSSPLHLLSSSRARKRHQLASDFFTKEPSPSTSSSPTYSQLLSESTNVATDTTPFDNCRTIVKQITEIPGARPKKIVKLIRTRRGSVPVAVGSTGKHLLTMYMTKNCTDPAQNFQFSDVNPDQYTKLSSGVHSSKTIKVSIYRHKSQNHLKSFPGAETELDSDY